MNLGLDRDPRFIPVDLDVAALFLDLAESCESVECRELIDHIIGRMGARGHGRSSEEFDFVRKNGLKRRFDVRGLSQGNFLVLNIFNELIDLAANLLLVLIPEDEIAAGEQGEDDDKKEDAFH